VTALSSDPAALFFTYPARDVSYVEVAEPPGADNPDSSLHSLIHRVLYVIEVLPNRVTFKGIRHGHGEIVLTSRNWNQYALVPAKKNGCESMAKFWPMVWMKPPGLELLIPQVEKAKTALAESKRDTSNGGDKRILGKGKPGR